MGYWATLVTLSSWRSPKLAWNPGLKPNSRPIDASRARSALKWARSYQNRFFEQILPKAMAARVNGEERVEKEGRRQVAEIREMINGIQLFIVAEG